MARYYRTYTDFWDNTITEADDNWDAFVAVNGELSNTNGVTTVDTGPGLPTSTDPSTTLTEIEQSLTSFVDPNVVHPRLGPNIVVAVNRSIQIGTDTRAGRLTCDGTARGQHFYFLNCDIRVSNPSIASNGFATIGHTNDQSLGGALGNAESIRGTDYTNTNSVNYINTKIDIAIDTALHRAPIFLITDFVDSTLFYSVPEWQDFTDRPFFSPRGGSSLDNSILDGSNLVENVNVTGGFRLATPVYIDTPRSANNLEVNKFFQQINNFDFVFPEYVQNAPVSDLTSDNLGTIFRFHQNDAGLVLPAPLVNIIPNGRILWTGTPDEGRVIASLRYRPQVFITAQLIGNRENATFRFRTNVEYSGDRTNNISDGQATATSTSNPLLTDPSISTRTYRSNPDGIPIAGTGDDLFSFSNLEDSLATGDTFVELDIPIVAVRPTNFVGSNSRDNISQFYRTQLEFSSLFGTGTFIRDFNFTDDYVADGRTDGYVLPVEDNQILDFDDESMEEFADIAAIEASFGTGTSTTVNDLYAAYKYGVHLDVVTIGDHPVANVSDSTFDITGNTVNSLVLQSTALGITTFDIAGNLAIDSGSTLTIRTDGTTATSTGNLDTIIATSININELPLNFNISSPNITNLPTTLDGLTISGRYIYSDNADRDITVSGNFDFSGLILENTGTGTITVRGAGAASFADVIGNVLFSIEIRVEVERPPGNTDPIRVQVGEYTGTVFTTYAEGTGDTLDVPAQVISLLYTGAEPLVAAVTGPTFNDEIIVFTNPPAGGLIEIIPISLTLNENRNPNEIPGATATLLPTGRLDITGTDAVPMGVTVNGQNSNNLITSVKDQLNYNSIAIQSRLEGDQADVIRNASTSSTTFNNDRITLDTPTGNPQQTLRSVFGVGGGDNVGVNVAINGPPVSVNNTEAATAGDVTAAIEESNDLQTNDLEVFIPISTTESLTNYGVPANSESFSTLSFADDTMIIANTLERIDNEVAAIKEKFDEIETEILEIDDNIDDGFDTFGDGLLSETLNREVDFDDEEDTETP